MALTAGSSLLARPLSKRFWTLSVWKNEDALRAFVQHQPHLRIMTALVAPKRGDYPEAVMQKKVLWS